MTTEHKPKQDWSETKSDYGKDPLPGSVKVPCKTPGCRGAVESGFVYNTAEWIEGFISKEYECPVCKSKTVYSRDDVEFVP